MKQQRPYEFFQKTVRHLLRGLPCVIHSRSDGLPTILRKSMPYLAIGTITMGLVGAITPSFRSYTLVYFENLRQLGISVQQVLDIVLGLTIILPTAYSIGIGVTDLLRYAGNLVVRTIEG